MCFHHLQAWNLCNIFLNAPTTSLCCKLLNLSNVHEYLTIYITCFTRKWSASKFVELVMQNFPWLQAVLAFTMKLRTHSTSEFKSVVTIHLPPVILLQVLPAVDYGYDSLLWDLVSWRNNWVLIVTEICDWQWRSQLQNIFTISWRSWKSVMWLWSHLWTKCNVVIQSHPLHGW